MTDLIDRLHAALGDGAVLTHTDDVAPYVADWTGRFRGAAVAVVRPADTEQVAAVVRICAEVGVAVVPQGGNTGLAGGATPQGGEVVLSLERMRRVRAVDPVADTITVEAGVVLHTVQEAAREEGRLFPLSLGSEGSCTIGGTIATNAGGTSVLRYGMMRDLVLGLEVVLADGRVWDGLRPLRKDNTGYDLKQLFIGSEGTLGIVTAAVLRLLPATPRRATALLALPGVEAAVELLPLLREHGGGLLTGWELLNRQAVDLVLVHLPGARDPFGAPHRWYGLVELAGTSSEVDDRLAAALEAAAERDLLIDAVVAGSPAQRAALWALREGVSEAQRSAGASVKHDVTLPIAALPRFVAEAGPRLNALLPGVRLVTYGHVGDGNLHYNLSGPAADAGALAPAAAELTRVVYDLVAAGGGSISAEHGLGALKRDAAARYKSDVELDLMRAVKDALDPSGLMNPGKVLAQGHEKSPIG
ncbi:MULTISPECIES: FAD-binding oxidoreductase [unclassified Nocardioides]|uniref:FAD-binding oxidoreductase n=1 Tax=unclassified Nocardioides TaxID=2615069 RepID=UPI003605AE49